MKRLNKYKILISFLSLLIATAWIIRILPFVGYSPIRGVFFANNFYGIVYVVENSHLFQVNSLNIGSGVGRNVYSSSADPFRSVYGAIIALVVGYSESPETIARFLTAFPWQGIFLFPSSVILVYRIHRKSIKTVEVIVLALVTMFGSYQVIYLTNTGTANAAVGWSFILISLWSLYNLEVKAGDYRYHLVLFISFLSILEWYHTAAIVFLFLMLVFAVPLPRPIGKRSSFTAGQFVLYLIAFFFHFQEVATTYYIGYIIKTSSLIRNIGSVFARADINNYRHLSAVASPLTVRIASIGSMLIVAVVFIGMSLPLFKKLLTDKEITLVEILAIRYALIVPLISLFVFVSFGLNTAIFRAYQYGFIIFPLVLGIWFSKYFRDIKIDKNVMATMLVVIFVIVSITTSYAYLNTPTRESGLIHENEYAAATWLNKHDNSNSITFTDYRLTSALLVNGNFRVTIIQLRNPIVTNRRLESIYYSKSGKVAAKMIHKIETSRKSPDYVYISTRMMDKNVGVNSYGTVFRALTEKEYGKFHESPYFNKYLDAGDGEIYGPNY